MKLGPVMLLLAHNTKNNVIGPLIFFIGPLILDDVV